MALECKPAFNVRLTAVGNNRVPVLALLRKQSELGAKDFRQLVDAGDLIVAKDVSHEVANRLADHLRSLGAQAEIEISIPDYN